MSETFQSAESLLTSERRIHCRQKVLYSCVEVDKNNGGIILNISQTGLTLQAVAELSDDEFLKVRFQLSRSQAWIEAKGRITWRSDGNRTAGVEFIDLPDEACKQIKTWMFLTSDAGGFGEGTARLPVQEPASANPLPKPRMEVLFAEDQSQHPIPKLTLPDVAEHDTSSSGRTLRLVGLSSVAAVLLLSVFIFFDHHLQQTGNSQKGSGTTVEPKPPEVFSQSSSTPSFNSNSSSDVSTGRPAFVLQVGAMAQEENASALTKSLRQQDFPAFVSKRGTNHLYYVVVGPYNGVDSTVKVKEELKNQGFEAIRREWKSSGDDNEVSKVQAAGSASQSKDKGQGELALARKYLREANTPGFGPKAVDLLWQAIEKGNRSAEVQLADLYLRGEVVPKNCEQARILISVAHNSRDSAIALNLPELPGGDCK